MELQFRPRHELVGQSYIYLSLPRQVTFSCNLAYTEGLKTAPACQKTNSNEFRFDNPFLEDEYPGNRALTMVFRQRELPGSNQMIKGIRIATYLVLEEVPQIVDLYDEPDQEFFAPEQQLFLVSEVITASEVTFTQSAFEFRMTLANRVPTGDAKIFITIPEQVRVNSNARSLIENSCSAL